MSSRPELKPFKVITNAPATADVISIPTVINTFSLVGYTVSWSSGVVGSFNVEVCNDAQFEVNGNYIAGTGTWVAITLSTPVTATGTAGTAFIDIDAISAANMRLHFVFTSGSGTINATVAGKAA